MATVMTAPALPATALVAKTLPTSRAIVLKTVVVHTVTYFFSGMFAYAVFDYATIMSQPPLNAWIRPLSHPMVMAGPLLQPIRGALFGFIFCLLREPFFQRRKGWLTMWAMLAGVGVFGTFAAPPASIEGLIYAPLPLSLHIRLLPEVLVQSLALSYLVFHWVNRPRKGVAWTLGVLFALVLFVSATALISLVAK